MSDEKNDDEKNSNEKKQDSAPFVALLQDPYGLKNIEISEAQERSDELDLDLDEGISASEAAPSDIFDIQELKKEIESELDQMVINNDDEKLGSLSRAMGEQDDLARKAAEELAEWAPDQQAQAQLAEQIAEDQALQAELKREDAEAEELDPELKAALPSPDPETGEIDLAELQSCIESLLFMVDKPLSLERLRDLLGPDFPFPAFQEAVTALKDKYQSPSHGIEVVDVAGGLQLRTKPGRAALARKLAKVQTQRLSTGAMETLAIVAYRQPVMKEDVDKIRGVDSSYFVRHLLDKKLIQISGRSELPGRPMLYGTTDGFLSLFGLKDLSALPSLREIEQMVPASQGGKPGDEDPRVKEMRRLVNQMTTDTSTTLDYDPREDEKILKEIRDRVNQIPTSTPYLEEQKAAEKAAQQLAASATATDAGASIAQPDSAGDPDLPNQPD